MQLSWQMERGNFRNKDGLFGVLALAAVLVDIIGMIITSRNMSNTAVVQPEGVPKGI